MTQTTGNGNKKRTDVNLIRLEKETMKVDKQARMSRATRIDVLFEKHKRFMGYYKSLAEFKQPVLVLIRKTGVVEFFEDATQGLFKYDSSDRSKETEEEIELHPKYQVRFSYGDSMFRGYICQEGVRFPLPQEPIIYAEDIKMFLGKIMTDYLKWQADLESVKSDKIIKWGFGIAAVVGGIALAYTMAPGLFEAIFKKTAQKAAESPAVQNATQEAANNTIRVITQSLGYIALFSRPDCHNRDCTYMKDHRCNAGKCIYESVIETAQEPEPDNLRGDSY